EAVPVDEHHPAKSDQHVPWREISMTGDQLLVFDTRRAERLDHAFKDTGVLRSDLDAVAYLLFERAHDSSHVTPLPRLCLTLVKARHQLHGFGEDIRVGVAELDERATFDALHDEHVEIQQVVNRLWQSRRPSRCSER